MTAISPQPAAAAFGQPGSGDGGLPRWVTALAGVLSIIVGLVALFWPKPTLMVVGFVFGIYLAVWSVRLLILGVAHGDVAIGFRILDVVLGLLGVLTGLALMVRPGQSVVTVALVLGFWWVVVGVLQIVRGIADPVGRIAHLLWGVLGLAAGIIILASPEIGLGTIVLVVGIGLIVQGLLELMLTFAPREGM